MNPGISAILMCLTFFTLNMTGIAHADDSPIGARSSVDAEATNDGAILVIGQIHLPGDQPVSYQGTEKVRVRRVVPACDGNQPTINAPKDTLCPQANALCAATPDPTDMMFWIFTGPPGITNPTPAQWTRTGQACLTRNQIPTAAVPIFTAADFRRLPLPAGVMHIQPDTGHPLINIPTNLYVTATPITLNTTLLGRAIRVRATPTTYTWTYGDTTTLTTTDPGAPYPQMTTTHTYTTPGPARLTLTTTYTGQYSVTNGPWLPIDGTATTQSKPQTLTLITAHTELIAGGTPNG